MKKSILIFDAGELICSVMVEIDNTKLNTTGRIHISYEGKEYEVMYVMGMEYGIIVPALIHVTEITDFTNLH